CVGELRSRMGDQGPKLIRTLPRRGYIFEADVMPVALGAEYPTPQTPATAVPEPAVPRASPSHWRKVGVPAAATLAALMVGSALISIYSGSANVPLRIDEEI